MTTATPTRPPAPAPSVGPAPTEPGRWRRYVPTPKFLTLGVVTLVIDRVSAKEWPDGHAGIKLALDGAWDAIAAPT